MVTDTEEEKLLNAIIGQKEEDLSEGDWSRYMRYAQELVDSLEEVKDDFEKERDSSVILAKNMFSGLFVRCWFAIPSVYVAPFAIIWMDIHLLLRVAFPSLFCKLGEEWLSMLPWMGRFAAKQGLKHSGGAGDNLSNGVAYIEGSVLAGLNLLLFLGIFVLLAIVAAVGYIVDKLGIIGLV